MSIAPSAGGGGAGRVTGSVCTESLQTVGCLHARQSAGAGVGARATVCGRDSSAGTNPDGTGPAAGDRSPGVLRRGQGAGGMGPRGG
ncbi:hypothetical protein GCM10010326_71680 [Streptomyces xanthochromogenes]|uniref:Uncharacterized protein n=1 Tax=Streptomyces xanthochromogenes TaxID=67384 RepID=A0ABQ3AUA3_9ACTN|nr:hypothetical protein GCM10010326_71680 [Streptomyces xanthochromogenes]